MFPRFPFHVCFYVLVCILSFSMSNAPTHHLGQNLPILPPTNNVTLDLAKFHGQGHCQKAIVCVKFFVRVFVLVKFVCVFVCVKLQCSMCEFGNGWLFRVCLSLIVFVYVFVWFLLFCCNVLVIFVESPSPPSSAIVLCVMFCCAVLCCVVLCCVVFVCLYVCLFA